MCKKIVWAIYGRGREDYACKAFISTVWARGVVKDTAKGGWVWISVYKNQACQGWSRCRCLVSEPLTYEWVCLQKPDISCYIRSNRDRAQGSGIYLVFFYWKMASHTPQRIQFYSTERWHLIPRKESSFILLKDGISYLAKNPIFFYWKVASHTRAGNSLIWFLSEPLIFCPKMSESLKKRAIHSYVHFWWAKWTIHSHR